MSRCEGLRRAEKPELHGVPARKSNPIGYLPEAVKKKDRFSVFKKKTSAPLGEKGGEVRKVNDRPRQGAGLQMLTGRFFPLRLFSNPIVEAIFLYGSSSAGHFSSRRPRPSFQGGGQ
jgi:hypothetical protein